MIKTLIKCKSSKAIATCILISTGLMYLSGCSMSDYRAPEAYPVNIIPVDSKFQNCAKRCLDEYAQCAHKTKHQEPMKYPYWHIPYQNGLLL